MTNFSTVTSASAGSTQTRLQALSDPDSGVVALPSRNRPKRRRHASRLLAKDLALMPVANAEDQAKRAKRSDAFASRPHKRRSPYLSYFSTLLAAVALGTSIGTAAMSDAAQQFIMSDKVIHPAGAEMTANIVPPA